ncbi:MAG: tRNA (guanosine(46)-N7)-methyltransferase TrmB [Bacteroidetes bacterium]|nr:tRNA (guanosine(46)-N7)-methyltransferase TrmB [Bacteroidota bacterium]
MSRKKLIRFDEMKLFSNTFEQPIGMKGKWHSDVFKNTNPMVLELGCGRGEYTIGLSTLFPDKNFIGIDLKGSRLWKGAKLCHLQHRTNTAFLRSRVELIESYFEPGEVAEIWITFPDPQPRDKWEKKRLTSMEFLDLYKRILKPGGLLHLKTDNTFLYHYTLELLTHKNIDITFYSDDVYSLPEVAPELNIETTYEKKFKALGETIKYIQFKL